MFGLKKRVLYLTRSQLSSKMKFLGLPQLKFYQHVKDLDEIMEKAKLEEEQRTAKYLEYTHKVYKPSKTITFDRNGEVLLYSCDNYRHVLINILYYFF
jgi:hypothetical protein